MLELGRRRWTSGVVAHERAKWLGKDKQKDASYVIAKWRSTLEEMGLIKYAGREG